MDAVVIANGTYECSFNCGSAIVHAPRDLRVSDFEPAVRKLMKGVANELECSQKKE